MVEAEARNKGMGGQQNRFSFEPKNHRRQLWERQRESNPVIQEMLIELIFLHCKAVFGEGNITLHTAPVLPFAAARSTKGEV